ncbi:hypothetical protein [Nostoc sp.]|uniref:hypothetical protein n=1 Tax=Nostoc sp. TaxID=1180 RepID=UPI002FFCDC46
MPQALRNSYQTLRERYRRRMALSSRGSGDSGKDVVIINLSATTLEMYKPEDAPACIKITRHSLKDLGLLAQIN